MIYFTKLIHFVITIITKYNIDESHGLSHAFNIWLHANHIYESEIIQHPELVKYENIIYISAILHDMCDKKYMDVELGLNIIEQFLLDIDTIELTHCEIKAICDIINTMSYSKVKVDGYPDLGEYQLAYHIVREADLLCAYDFDRCMIYHMFTRNSKIEHAFMDAVILFNNRIFQHNNDKLFLTEYSKILSKSLESQSHMRIAHWRKILYP